MLADGRSHERVERGLEIRHIYENIDNKTIDTTNMSVEETVNEIIRFVS